MSNLRAFIAWLRVERPRVATAAVVCLLTCFAVLKLYSLNFVKGDEHMYFYMGLLVSKGAWPYRDFFFSHPPLQVCLMAALYKVFGYSLVLSKAVPSVAAMVAGLHVYLIGRRLVSRCAGLLALALFLFTFDVIRGSSHFTGVNCALAFGLAGAYQAISRRPLIAGVLLGVGTFMGVYIAPLAFMLGVLLLLRSPKEALRLLGSYLALCAVICLIFVAKVGHIFWYAIFTYNLSKAAFPYSWFHKFRNVAYLNTAVMIGFLPGIVWGISRWISRGRERGPRVLPRAVGRFGAWVNLWGGDSVAAQILFATLVCGYWYFYSTRVDYYSYYFILIMPWMALMTATLAVDVARYLGDRLVAGGPIPAATESGADLSRAERRRRERAARKGHPGRPAGAVPASWRVWPLVLCAGTLLCTIAYRQSIGADRQTEMGEDPRRYTWRDSPYLPGFVNRLVKALFWSSEGDPTHPGNPITYYLQHETLSATTQDEFVRAVRTECKPGERIFGEYSLGPFAAALGPCVLAANLADTNSIRLRAHESTASAWVRALEQDHLDIAIIASGSAMMKEPVLRDYLTGTFPRTVAKWDDPYVGHVELRRRH